VVDEPIAFDGSASGDFDNQDGTAANDQTLTYSWDFGDGFVGTGINPTHSYSAADTYTVTLVVNDGVVDSESANTTVEVTEPAAGVSVDAINPNSVVEGGSVSVTISGSGFHAGALVSLEGGQGPTPKVSDVLVLDATTVEATISTKSGGPPKNRLWDVRVTNPDTSSGVLEDGFTVTPK